ncbi:MAG: alkyl hydroperoxide reductase subunit F, partial [Aeromonas molluscorum]
MLDTNLKQQLNGYLQYIVNPIEISVSGNDSDKSAELLALAREISDMSPKISMTDGSNTRKPSMSIAPQG